MNLRSGFGRIYSVFSGFGRIYIVFLVVLKGFTLCVSYLLDVFTLGALVLLDGFTLTVFSAFV